ncbi:MAG: hypothetical protein KAX38_06820, partial [Candidatus Krumholzibacteria bacterium]|nr:hypothetical protein [Candidatus Krumholzibacteria bacterium]
MHKNNFASFWKIPSTGVEDKPYLLRHPPVGSNPRLLKFDDLGYLYMTFDQAQELPWEPKANIQFNPDEAVENLLFEKYIKVKESKSACLGIYYKIRPSLPRRAQLLFRRIYSFRQRRKAFPAWPFDPSLYELYRILLASEMKVRETDEIRYIGFWPGGKRFCFVLTHDVETEKGFKNIDRLLKVEKERDVRSSWNIVPERYDFSPKKLSELVEDGFEIGLHGLYHDGLLFSSRKIFEERLPRLKESFKRMGAVGFRSPATHRNVEWMSELGCLYDSSFPDTDPFEPQAGGSLSIFPYFLDGMLELPYTLPQDHTLFEILGEKTAAIWIDKTERIARCGGMALAIIHPDYATSEKRLDCVRALIDHVLDRGDAWIATPNEVCRWWLSRRLMSWDESGGIKADTDTINNWKPIPAKAILE